MGTRPEVLELLPVWVREELPVVLTHKGTIDKCMLDLVVSKVMRTSNFIAASDHIREVQMQGFHRTNKEEYYHHCNYVLGCGKKGGSWPFQKSDI